MDVAEAAVALGLSRNSTYAAISRGEIPSLRINGRVLVPVTALNALLDATGTAVIGAAREQRPNSTNKKKRAGGRS
jgi:excisionase family DNA binding protein